MIPAAKFQSLGLKGLIIILVLPAFILLISCNKNYEEQLVQPADKTLDDLVISSTFNWSTLRNVDFSITARDNQGAPLPNVRFNVYSASPDSGGVYMFGGFTDAAGVWTVTQPVPTYMNKVTITNDYVGLIKEQTLPVTGTAVSGQFGGLVPAPVNMKSSRQISRTNLAGVYYLGTFQTNGVPNYLEPVNDIVNQQFLNDLNATLPESHPVPTYHPEYLANTVPDNLGLIELCDVWVTYITEGAGWMNSVGFFTFPTGQPPTSASAIDSIKIVFPNMSNAGSGGGLNPGNKVYIGRFPAGRSIGWVVFANGWNGSGVGEGNYRIYSIPGLNPEPAANLKKHTLLLRDGGRQSILFSFEDWRRDQGSDQDFNDGILYVKANPVTAINTDQMPQITTTIPDTDGDGVPDNTDDYPTDPTKAFDNWYPSKTGYGTLAFEDLWPGKGDYDFNDLIVSYRFNQITNSQNKVVQVKATLITEAMGANLHNALAFQMPITPAQVASITGIDLRHGLVTVAANNTEMGQSKAVFVVYDDAYDRLPPPGSGIGTNTEPGAPWVTPDTMRITINLTAPVTVAAIGSPPYNPFIIVDQNRNREVHLADLPPTDKVNGSDFGTSWDDTKPAQGRYYKTATNLPWAINIAEKYNYTIERSAINTGFLKFATWAESSGVTYADWYKNLGGYRDNTKIYTHP
jgi:LruC domain-containing protein